MGRYTTKGSWCADRGAFKTEQQQGRSTIRDL